MRVFSKILVPLDLSSRGETTMPMSLDLADPDQGVVWLLHVIETVEGADDGDLEQPFHALALAAQNHRLALRLLKSLSRALRALDLRFAALERLGSGTGGSALAMEEMSRLMQRGLLPDEAPRIKGFDLAAGTNLEDDGAGRTIWDHFQLSDGRAALVSLNVQGDGLPPGHYLAMARSLLSELARDHDTIQGLLARVNSGLAAAVVEGMEQYVEAGILLPSSDRIGMFCRFGSLELSLPVAVTV